MTKFYIANENYKFQPTQEYLEWLKVQIRLLIIIKSKCSLKKNGRLKLITLWEILAFMNKEFCFQMCIGPQRMFYIV